MTDADYRSSEERIMPAISGLDQGVSGDDLERLFRRILGRAVGDEAFKAQCVGGGATVEQVIGQLMDSAELRVKFKLGWDELIDGGRFRVPDALVITPLQPRKVLLIGSCAFDPFHAAIEERESGTIFEKITFNNASPLPPIDAEEAAGIDFQIVQVPTRSVLLEHMYFSESTTEDNARRWLEESKTLLAMNFEAATTYGREHGVQTLVMNLLTPQQNPLGRLQNPYSLRNLVFYIGELNRYLFKLIDGAANTYLIDADQIAATLGKRYIQDDSVTHMNHGSTLMDMIAHGDDARIEPIGHVPTLYGAKVANFNLAVYDEALAAYRSLRQHEAIKLVIFDLDETLWRGVAAERMDALDYTMTEGWPLGILEAASFLHKRGILLAVVSKNDKANVEAIWKVLHEHRLPFDTFVAQEINWDPKPDNIRKIIERVNVRADAVLFVDDNPVERAAVRADVPGIRLIDAPLAEWRRILLWSAELQPALITEEGRQRAGTIKGKAERDEAVGRLGHEAFLKQLELKITSKIVTDIADPQFPRCLELINKTNQFNTSGQRWTEAELRALFAAGGWLQALSVRDRYVAYGLTCVAICSRGRIIQYLMSCRVFGMGLEEAAIALSVDKARADGATVNASILDTGKNRLAHDLFFRLGFVKEGEGQWTLPEGSSPAMPEHIVVEG